MKIADITGFLEQWGPRDIAWDRDNTGLQIGDVTQPLKNILLCMDLQEEVIDDALSRNCNLIITHHPFLFLPLKKLDLARDPKSKLIRQIINNNLCIYSMHTNLDFTADGVSFTLAKLVGLDNISFLAPIEKDQYKITVFVPENSAEVVGNAMFSAGAGIIGNYSGCSFRSSGTGTFFGNENSNPAAGVKNRFEKVEEIRLEVVADAWLVERVVKAMTAAHPYEEPAYDIYPVTNKNKNYGIGAIGEYENPVKTSEFLEIVSKAIDQKCLRYSRNHPEKIKKVAMTGGSGFEYMKFALAEGADAYLTADLKYHDFQSAEGKILLIDGGHYETEQKTLKTVKNKIQKHFGKEMPAGIYFAGVNSVRYFYTKKENK
ncbi:MAG: Nif3-like dinuclear metal center hexameric protein [Ignavibacteriaceae bacterium]|nr:Nif3-like dinuclear metal center hexameric protein [Ignavibacteriaceae bacterium]NUM70387.1 Nif3-like dinuclear metal center hexameric protein [Ignavibacteriaceae bacterium]